MLIFEALAAIHLLFLYIMMMSTKETVYKQITIYSFNASSIRGKLQEFNSHFDAASEYDIISLSESWLHDGVYDEEVLYGTNYNIFRRDRDKLTSHKTDGGGGVLLAVNPLFPAKRRSDLETSMEIIWVELKINDFHKVYVGTAYLSYPNLSVLSMLEDSLDKVHLVAKPQDSIVLLGDFNNMSDITFGFADNTNSHATALNSAGVCHISSRFLDILHSNELVQHNTLPTCNGKPLDLVITNELPVTVSIAAKACSSIHDGLEVKLNLPGKTKSECVKRCTFNYKKADFSVIHQLLARIC